LQCTNNHLSNLALSNNTVLYWLNCSDNQLTTIDVSNNTSLNYMHCNNNPNLTEIWLKTGQEITNFSYDTDISTIRYKD